MYQGLKMFVTFLPSMPKWRLAFDMALKNNKSLVNDKGLEPNLFSSDPKFAVSGACELFVWMLSVPLVCLRPPLPIANIYSTYRKHHKQINLQYACNKLNLQKHCF